MQEVMAVVKVALQLGPLAALLLAVIWEVLERDYPMPGHRMSAPEWW